MKKNKSLDFFCVPSKQQHDFCLINYDLFKNPVEQCAANNIISGYHSEEEVPLNFICLVNQMMRKF